MSFDGGRTENPKFRQNLEFRFYKITNFNVTREWATQVLKYIDYSASQLQECLILINLFIHTYKLYFEPFITLS